MIWWAVIFILIAMGAPWLAFIFFCMALLSHR